MTRAPAARFPVTRMPLIIRFALVPRICQIVIIVLLHISRIKLSLSIRPIIAVVVLVPAMNPSVAIVTILPDVSPLVTIVIPVP